MRPPELETKLETGAFGQDVLYTRYGDTPPNAVCIAPRTMPTAPGDALKIVDRLFTWPELVEALDECSAAWPICICDNGDSCVTCRLGDLLDRCKEVPK